MKLLKGNMKNITRIDYIKDFDEIVNKDSNYFIFNGLLECLTPEEVCLVVESLIKKGINKRKLIAKKLNKDLKINNKECHEKLFKKLLKNIDSLSTYYQKEFVSLILVDLASYMKPILQEELVKYFLNSRYINNRKRAYWFISKNWDKKFSTLIVDSWKKYYDEKILYLLITKVDKKILFENFDSINEMFADAEDFFDTKVLRNYFYVNIAEFIPKIIESLKDKDPISYIFINKQIGNKIDIEYAKRIYKNNSQSQRYLAYWYGQMGMWKLLQELKS